MAAAAAAAVPRRSSHVRGNHRSKSRGCHWTVYLMTASILSWVGWIAFWQPPSMRVYHELLDEDLTVAARARAGRNQQVGLRNKTLRRIVDLDQPTVELRPNRRPRQNSIARVDDGEATVTPTASTTTDEDDDDDDDAATEEPVRNHNMGFFKANAQEETATIVPIVGHEEEDDDDAAASTQEEETTATLTADENDSGDDDDDDEDDDDNISGDDDNFEQPETFQKKKKVKIKKVRFKKKAAVVKKSKDKALKAFDPSITRKGLALPEHGPYPDTILGDNGTHPENPKFFFVHIGKAGGSTAYSNIRNLCLRKVIEHNLLIQWHHRRNIEKNMTRYKFFDHPVRRLETTACIGKLNRQSNPDFHDPPTEMLISLENMVVGYIHMNFLRYWWNANEDGEATNYHPDKPNSQDEITAILSLPGGEKNAYDVYKLAHPPSTDRNPKDSGMTDATAFIFSIRDPVDRLVSAFNYHHPNNHIQQSNCDRLQETEERYQARFIDEKEIRRPFKWWVLHSFYCACFPTVNDLADAITGTAAPQSVKSANDPDEKIACNDIARTILRGHSAYKPDDQGFEFEHAKDLKLVNETRRDDHVMIGHISLNYGYYYRRTLSKHPQKDVVVLRTDHVWEDLQKLELDLGGTAVIEGRPTGHSSVSYGSGSFEVSAKISGTTPDEKTKRTHALCCAIATEVRVYRDLLEKATNLSDEQRNESLAALQEKCGDLSRCNEGDAIAEAW